ncbi:MAG: AAA family ATPase [Fibrobacterota bacterium]
MLITHIKLKNWKNFQELDIPLRDVTYILGANAAGKSNLLDALRFLRDVSKPKGGGLESAVADRGGMSKVRCLHARRHPEVVIEVTLAESPDGPVAWRYKLAFKSEGRNSQRPVVSQEEVWKNGDRDPFLTRPNNKDDKDPAQLRQTHLEQIQANAKFRDLVDFFESFSYLNLVPQLLKFSEQIGGRQITDDPFGQGFLERLAKTTEKTRDSRLKKINAALKMAVPHFEELRFKPDVMGRPHLEARYAHHRPNAGWQSEEQFSDGTLRLLGLLWSMLEGQSLLMLEEPEISLNDEIVKQIPLMLQRLLRGRKTSRQVLVSTHSDALLSNLGLDGRGVVLLEMTAQGTRGRPLSATELSTLDTGLTIAEVVLPMTRPAAASQLGLWEP